MRVTNSMTDKAALDSGLPINGNSIINNPDGDGKNQTLLDALDRKKEDWNTAAVATKTSTGLQKLGATADTLEKQAKGLAAAGVDSPYSTALASGSTEGLVESTQRLVESYNETIRQLRQSNNGLNEEYGEMLREAAFGVYDKLAGIGLSVKGDGSILVDDDKLKGASVEQMQEALAGEGQFAAKVALVAGHVSESADTLRHSLSSGYSAKGYEAYAYADSRYDFFG